MRSLAIALAVLSLALSGPSPSHGAADDAKCRIDASGSRPRGFRITARESSLPGVHLNRRCLLRDEPYFGGWGSKDELGAFCRLGRQDGKLVLYFQEWLRREPSYPPTTPPEQRKDYIIGCAENLDDIVLRPGVSVATFFIDYGFNLQLLCSYWTTQLTLGPDYTKELFTGERLGPGFVTAEFLSALRNDDGERISLLGGMMVNRWTRVHEERFLLEAHHHLLPTIGLFEAVVADLEALTPALQN